MAAASAASLIKAGDQPRGARAVGVVVGAELGGAGSLPTGCGQEDREEHACRRAEGQRPAERVDEESTILVANLLIGDAYAFRACISARQEELQTRRLSVVG